MIYFKGSTDDYDFLVRGVQVVEPAKNIYIYIYIKINTIHSVNIIPIIIIIPILLKSERGEKFGGVARGA